MTGMMKATNQIAILCFVAVATIPEPSNSFVPLSHLGTTQGARIVRILSAGPFDWINDVFGDKTKKVEEEKAAAKARAEAEVRKKAEEANAAAAAVEAQKQVEEKAKAKRAEEDAAMLAKAEAASRLEKFEAEQKAKNEKKESEAATKAKAEAEAAAAAATEALAGEEAAPKSVAEVAFEKAARENADAVTAKVIAQVEVSKDKKEEANAENAEDDVKEETTSKDKEDSINDLIEEAAENNSRIMGVVQWYDTGSGFGFIKPYRTEAEEKELIKALRNDRMEKVTEKKSATYSTGVFVHHTVIKAPDDTFFRKLNAIESVEFGIGFDKQGRSVAKNVTGPDGNYVKHIVKQQQQRTTKQK